MFVFEGLYWENIVGIFKSFCINFYGGSYTRRHLLNTVQASLVKILLLSDNLNIEKKTIYNSFNIVNKKIINLFKDKNYLNLLTVNDESEISDEYKEFLFKFKNLIDVNKEYSYKLI